MMWAGQSLRAVVVVLAGLGCAGGEGAPTAPPPATTMETTTAGWQGTRPDAGSTRSTGEACERDSDCIPGWRCGVGIGEFEVLNCDCEPLGDERCNLRD